MSRSRRERSVILVDIRKERMGCPDTKLASLRSAEDDEHDGWLLLALRSSSPALSYSRRV